MQKAWFKTFIWFVSTAMFFLISSIIISEFSPEPSEQEVMAYMAGMMQAMETSLMGLSMTIEQDVELKRFILNATSITFPLVFIGIAGGIFIRVTRRKNSG
jgi:hypothetical protein